MTTVSSYMRTIFSCMLAVVLACGMVPTAAFAGGGTSSSVEESTVSESSDTDSDTGSDSVMETDTDSGDEASSNTDVSSDETNAGTDSATEGEDTTEEDASQATQPYETTYSLDITVTTTAVSSKNSAAKTLKVSKPKLTTTVTNTATGEVVSTTTKTYGLTVQCNVRNKGWKTAKAKSSTYVYTAAGASSGSYIQAVRITPSDALKKAMKNAGVTFYYRATSKNFGTLGWAKAGYAAGSSGNSCALKKVTLKVINIEDAASLSTENRYLKATGVQYKTKKTGSSKWYASKKNGKTNGKTNHSKTTLGCIAIKLNADSAGFSPSGTLKYSVRTSKADSSSKWSSYTSGYKTAGSKSSKIRGIKIKLTDDMATYYDVYYRVYVRGYGWLGWACNGQKAGTANTSCSISAVQVKLVAKGKAAPGKTSRHYVKGLSTASWSTIKQAIKSRLGTPYVWGGKSTKGWDCSGFASYIMKNYYGTDWPGGTWKKSNTPEIAEYCQNAGTYVTTIKSISAYNKAVKNGTIQPGDILMFYGKSIHDSGTVHVAIAGSGTTIYHARNKNYGTLANSFATIWKKNGPSGSNVYHYVKVYRGL